MSFKITNLEPHIRDILSAPGTDLATISAKNVRRKLLELDPTLTPELLKEHKEQLDLVIRKVFEAVSGTDEAPEEPKRKQEDDTNAAAEEEEEEDAPSPPPKKAKKAKRELSDAELARQLSSEINGRASRQRNGSTRKASSAKLKAVKNGKKVKKSADFIDSEESGGEDGNRSAKKTKTVRKKSTGIAKGGFAKEYSLSYVSLVTFPSPSYTCLHSEPLSILLSTNSLSRPQVVKQLWEYIKSNDLQNPSNKREILCDEMMRNVFGVDKIDMFKMSKVLGM